MTLLTFAPARREESDVRGQAHVEALVRRLLRRTGDASRLAEFPLAQALCEATGIANAQAAVRHVVETAFAGGPGQAELRDLIVASDLDARLSRTESATQLRVSRRHLQRYRAQAVTVLARHIRDLVGSPALGAASNGATLGDPLEMLGETIAKVEPATAAQVLRAGGARLAKRAERYALRARMELGGEIENHAGELQAPVAIVLRAQTKEVNGKVGEERELLRELLYGPDRDLRRDPEVQFELEWLAFLRARHRGDAAECRRVAASLQRIAGDRAGRRSRALLARAEAALHLGATHEAAERLDDADRRNLRDFGVMALASACGLRAEIALLEGDNEAAERLASGAYAVLRGRHRDAYRCAATVGRARLRLGKPWSPSPAFGPTDSVAFDRVVLDVERARHLFSDGFVQRGDAVARQALRAAEELGYDALIARAAATLGLRERALAALLRTRDRLAACDLFAQGGAFGDAEAALLQTALNAAIPQLRLEESSEAAAVRRFLRAFGAYVLGATSFVPFGDAAQRAGEEAGTFAFFALRFARDVLEIAAPLFIALSEPARRRETGDRVASALRVFAERARPQRTLRYVVG